MLSSWFDQTFLFLPQLPADNQNSLPALQRDEVGKKEIPTDRLRVCMPRRPIRAPLCGPRQIQPRALRRSTSAASANLGHFPIPAGEQRRD